MNSRLKMLSGLLPEYADSALIISNENRRYFTDFVSSSGYLLVTRQESYLLVDFRYSEAARKKAKGCTVVTFTDFENTVKELIKKYSLRDIMLEGSAFTLNLAESIEKIIKSSGANVIKSSELDKIIGRMRIVKTAEEVNKIRQAQTITEDALTETLPLIKEGVTELDLAIEIEYKMKKMGASGVSFDLIVISGKKTSMPHGVPSNNKIKAGDFITFDIGAVVDGYHSDMTRTFAYGGVDDKQVKVYNTVLQAQLNALDEVCDGVSCRVVDEAARTYINQAGYEGFFGHSTGHGVGLEIHENPTVSMKNDFVLHSGMVITVEPGIYIPDKFGVRIEDMVVVTKNGCINLTTLSKELIVL